MNKAFEVIEAKWLFDLSPDQIRVVIHPQSIVHSLVAYRDGAMIAQLGLPSMKVPIAYAFGYPARLPEIAPQVDLSKLGTLTFSDPEGPLKQSLDLAMQILQDATHGFDSSAVYLNGANEALVRLFLEEKIAFVDIIKALRVLLLRHIPHKAETLEEILAVDAKARQDAVMWAEE
jgi:1-deoxy-D-xylulose-5-phosphate reductoisomerase